MKKYTSKLKILYIIILALYPLAGIGRGLSVMDTTYSLSNFACFGKMDGTWMVATYLANVLGSGLMRLPFGSTMLGMNVYTSLVVSLTAVTAFIFLKRDVNEHALFIGEFLALNLCWCPTTILYNYLTYLLFTLGALVLYRGLSGGKDDCYPAAGIILGLNVGTRFPNVTEAALILAVWYVGVINRKKFGRVLKETLMCLAGYAVGFGIILATIVVRYNGHAYSDMIKTLFAMTDKAEDYKPLSMITAMFGDYIYAWKWIAILAAGMLAASLIYALGGRICAKNTAGDGSVKNSKRCGIIYTSQILLSFLLMLAAVRVCFGQGMFSFRYYEYGSMYYWAVMMILASTVMCLIYIFIPESDPGALTGPSLVLHHKKILSAIVLIMMYITCLGSNNALYPSVNNLFIAGPYFIWILWDITAAFIRDRKTCSPAKAAAVPSLRFGASVLCLTIAAALLIQGTGFHSSFALQDGDDGTPRDAVITGYARTYGIHTTQANAENLQGVMDYVDENGTDVKSVILYGNDPGLGYLLGKRSALSTFWPDLDSYTYGEWSSDLDAVKSGIEAGEGAPYVITSIQVAAWEGGDSEACEYWGVNEEKFTEDEKLADLTDFLREYGYTQVYCNDGYSVYCVEN